MKLIYDELAIFSAQVRTGGAVTISQIENLETQLRAAVPEGPQPAADDDQRNEI